MQYVSFELLEHLALLVLLLRAIRLTHNVTSERASAKSWKAAHQRCEDGRDRMSSRKAMLEEANAELKMISRQKDELIDRLEKDLEAIRDDYNHERRVTSALIDAKSAIDDAKVNGVGQMRRDVTLGELIARHHSLGELDRMARYLEVVPDNLSKEGLEERAYDLVSYLRRRGRIDELLVMLSEERGHVEWRY